MTVTNRNCRQRPRARSDKSIASAVIGGVSMAGGEGNVIGAVIGAVIIVVINNGLNLLGVSPYIQTAIKGLVIFVAIAADVIRRRKQLEP